MYYKTIINDFNSFVTPGEVVTQRSVTTTIYGSRNTCA